MALALQAALLVVQLFLFAAVIWFFLYSLKPFATGVFNSPPLRTPRAAAYLVARALDIKSSDIVYELGCADGRLLLALYHIKPQAQYIGIEQDLIPYVIAKVRLALAGNPKHIKLIRADVFKCDIREATKIYSYLLPHVMRELLPKLEFEFNGVIASRAFPFPERKSAREIVRLTQKEGSHGEHLLYVYDFKE